MWQRQRNCPLLVSLPNRQGHFLTCYSPLLLPARRPQSFHLRVWVTVFGTGRRSELAVGGYAVPVFAERYLCSRGERARGRFHQPCEGAEAWVRMRGHLHGPWMRVGHQPRAGICRCHVLGQEKASGMMCRAAGRRHNLCLLLCFLETGDCHKAGCQGPPAVNFWGLILGQAGIFNAMLSCLSSGQ